MRIRKWVLFGAFAALSTSFAGTPNQSARDNHVIVVTFDGMRPQFYLPGDLSSNCPTLVSLRDSGSYAKAAYPPYPSFTYPGHTAIATGDYPARTGITANEHLEPIEAKPRWFWFASDIQVPAIWDVAHQAGLTVGTASWPVSADSKSIDWDFPEFSTSETGLKQYHEHTSAALLTEIETDAGPIEKGGQINTAPWDNFIAAAALRIIREHRPNLLMVHFIESDHVQHTFGPSAPELPETLRRLDSHLRDLIEATKKAGIFERTTFLIMGDHGFAEEHQRISPNVLLAQENLLTVQDKKVTTWKAYVQNTGGSAGVYLKDPADRDTLEKVRDILRKNGTDPGGKALYRIIEKDELVKLGGPRDAVFYLEAEPGIIFSGGATGEFIRPQTLKGNHGYMPAKIPTGFIASGRAIKKGVVLDSIHLVDVAPTIARLLGLEMNDTDGHALKEIVE